MYPGAYSATSSLSIYFTFRLNFFSVWRISRPTGFFVLLNFSSNCDMNQPKRLIFQFPIIKKLDSSILGFKKFRIFDVRSKFLDDRWFNEYFAGNFAYFEKNIYSWYQEFTLRSQNYYFTSFASSWKQGSAKNGSDPKFRLVFWLNFKIKFFSGPEKPGSHGPLPSPGWKVIKMPINRNYFLTFLSEAAFSCHMCQKVTSPIYPSQIFHILFIGGYPKTPFHPLGVKICMPQISDLINIRN